MRPILLCLALVPALTSCESAYYATMEKFGVEKRDILVDRIEEAREDQTEAKEQFQTTYEAFQALTQFDGGDLEKLYKKLKSEYDDSVDEASDVSSRIDSIEDVAADLFREWESEIDEITDSGLRAQSQETLRDTQTRYGKVVSSMRQAESKMAPVLEAFNNHILALKHQLNAAAIASLEDQALQIETDVSLLIKQMEASIAEADEFLDSMSTQG